MRTQTAANRHDTINDGGNQAPCGKARASAAQRAYLKLGIGQPGGKLPLFDPDGQLIPVRTIRACIERGWAEQWFENPVKPDWLVCRLTDAGRSILEAGD